MRDFRRFVFRPRSAPTLPRPRQSLISAEVGGTNFSVISASSSPCQPTRPPCRAGSFPRQYACGVPVETQYVCVGSSNESVPCTDTDILLTDLLTDRSQAGKFSKIFARCARRQIFIQIFENPHLPQVISWYEALGELRG